MRVAVVFWGARSERGGETGGCTPQVQQCNCDFRIYSRHGIHQAETKEDISNISALLECYTMLGKGYEIEVFSNAE